METLELACLLEGRLRARNGKWYELHIHVATFVPGLLFKCT